MNATLTPSERATVTRFGIHDPEAFHELTEGVFAECVTPGCDAAAVWACFTRCCGDVILLCGEHHARAVRRASRPIAVHCSACGHRFGPFPSYWDVFAREERL